MSFIGIFSCCIQLKVLPRPPTCNGRSLSGWEVPSISKKSTSSRWTLVLVQCCFSRTSTIWEYWSTAHCPCETMRTECVGLRSTSCVRFVQYENLWRVRLPRPWYMLSSRVDSTIVTACYMELTSHYWISCKPSCVPLLDWFWRNSSSTIFWMIFVTSCTGYLSSRESISKSACMYAGVFTMRHLLTCRTCSLPSWTSMLCGAIVPLIEPT